MAVTQVPTADNTSDIFTKALGKLLFLKHKDGLGLRLVPPKAGAGGAVDAHVAVKLRKRKKRVNGPRVQRPEMPMEPIVVKPVKRVTFAPGS